jgi:L-asparagine oxygenase
MTLSPPTRAQYGDLASQMAEHGFVFSSRLEPALSTNDIAWLLGDVLTFGKSYPAHEVLAKRSAAPNTYSGMYGLNAFPPHTDMAHWHLPPRYLLLRSARGYSSVRTLVLDGKALVATVGPTCVARAIVRPRRPHEGKLPLLPLYRHRNDNGVSLLRWDEQFIVPASPVGREGVNKFRKAIVASSPISIALANPGDTLVIDNWRMLHARSEVPDECSDRVIERTYLRRLH